MVGGVSCCGGGLGGRRVFFFFIFFFTLRLSVSPVVVMHWVGLTCRWWGTGMGWDELMGGCKCNGVRVLASVGAASGYGGVKKKNR